MNRVQSAHSIGENACSLPPIYGPRAATIGGRRNIIRMAWSLSAHAKRRNTKRIPRTSMGVGFAPASANRIRTWTFRTRHLFTAECRCRRAPGRVVICGWKTQKEIKHLFAWVFFASSSGSDNWACFRTGPQRGSESHWIVADSLPAFSEGIHNRYNPCPGIPGD